MNIRLMTLPTLFTIACVSFETSTFAAEDMEIAAPAGPVVAAEVPVNDGVPPHIKLMESRRGTMEFYQHTTPTTAPFSAAEVIAHAETYPDNYDMVLLRSAKGTAQVEAFLEIVRTTGFPPNDLVGANERWNRSAPDAKYNMSVVAHYVSTKEKK